MECTIYEEHGFVLINKDGKPTWVKKGSENMSTETISWNQIIHEQTQAYVNAGSPVPDEYEFIWIPYYKSGNNYGYALIDCVTSQVVAKLKYIDGFFDAAQYHPTYMSLGEFVDAEKAMIYVEEYIYGPEKDAEADLVLELIGIIELLDLEPMETLGKG